MVVKNLLSLFAAILLVTTMVSANEFEEEKQVNLSSRITKPNIPILGNGHTPQLPTHEDHGDNSQFKDWHQSSSDDGSFVQNEYGRKFGYRSNHEGSVSEGNNHDFSNIIHEEPFPEEPFPAEPIPPFH